MWEPDGAVELRRMTAPLQTQDVFIPLRKNTVIWNSTSSLKSLSGLAMKTPPGSTSAAGQIITHSNTQVEVVLEEFQVRLAAILTWKHLLN